MPGLKLFEEIGGLLRGGKAFRNWHGSQHLFAPEPGAPLGRFNLAKRGTGEGGAAFGAGAYSADKRALGERYQKELGASNPRFEGPEGVIAPSALQQRLVQIGRDAEPKLRQNDSLAYHMANKAMQRDMRAAWRQEVGQDYYQRMLDEAGKYKRKENPGHLYELEIQGHPDIDFLQQNMPLSQQSPKVKEALRGLGVDTDDAFATMKIKAEDLLQTMRREQGGMALVPAINGVRKARTPQELHDAFYASQDAAYQGSSPLLDEWISLRSDLFSGQHRGAGGMDAYQALSRRMGGPEAASGALKDRGVSGMRYLDQFARTGKKSGGGITITFDDRIIEVVNRYGLAALVASGVISQELAQALQDQGIDKTTNDGVGAPSAEPDRRRFGG